jgi:hypothetical protein
MTTLVFRTSGRKIKKQPPTAEQRIYNLLIATGSTPKEARNRIKFLQIRNAVQPQPESLTYKTLHNAN